MRLIDADAFMDAWNLNNATKYGNKDADQQRFSYGTMMMYEIADAIEDAPTVEAVPLSVIEGIKAEIKELKSACRFLGLEERANGFSEALAIIDKAVKEYTHDEG